MREQSPRSLYVTEVTVALALLLCSLSCALVVLMFRLVLVMERSLVWVLQLT